VRKRRRVYGFGQLAKLWERCSLRYCQLSLPAQSFLGMPAGANNNGSFNTRCLQHFSQDARNDIANVAEANDCRSCPHAFLAVQGECGWCISELLLNACDIMTMVVLLGNTGIVALFSFQIKGGGEAEKVDRLEAELGISLFHSNQPSMYVFSPTHQCRTQTKHHSNLHFLVFHSS